MIDRFWHLRMESHTEEMASSLLNAGIEADIRANFEPAAIKVLCDMLAKAGRDSQSASESKTLGFSAAAVPVSLRALKRLRDMLLRAGTEAWGAANSSELLRSLIRVSFTEALDATARETAEGILMTALGDIVGTLRASHRRVMMNRR